MAVLYDLVKNRPGVAYVSIASPDGVVRDVHRDSAGEFYFEEYFFEPERLKRHRWLLQNGIIGDAEPVVEEMPPALLTERPYYREAVAARRRSWTAPYRLLALIVMALPAPSQFLPLMVRWRRSLRYSLI